MSMKTLAATPLLAIQASGPCSADFVTR